VRRCCIGIDIDARYCSVYTICVCIQHAYWDRRGGEEGVCSRRVVGVLPPGVQSPLSLATSKVALVVF
jgi:hypothetical protein